MHVELRAEAREDIFQAAAFYDDQHEGLGDRFVDSVFVDLASLETQAGIHPVIHRCYRKLTKRFPFAIYYKFDTELIEVVAILDCRQSPQTTDKRLRS